MGRSNVSKTTTWRLTKARLFYYYCISIFASKFVHDASVLTAKAAALNFKIYGSITQQGFSKGA